MAQQDNASKLATAKGVLAGAKKAFPSSMAPKSSIPAAPKATPIAAAPKASPLPSVNVNSRAGNISLNRDILSPGDTSIPKMHNGGPVLADGAYQLKAGEHVLTESEAKKARKHALMAAGMKSLSNPGKASSVKGGAKKTSKDIKRPGKVQDDDAPVKMKS